MNYQELCEIDSFEDRISYLMLKDKVGDETYGPDRWINQRFYASYEWKKIRNSIIARDLGRDLAYPGMEIYGKIIVHHISPITKEDIIYGSLKIFDPNNLVCVSLDTHNTIHYGQEAIQSIVVRKPNDTCPWKE